jgi:hypothetical protein
MKKKVLFMCAWAFLVSGPVFPWSQKTQQTIAVHAISMMPPALRSILEMNKNFLAEGAVAPFHWRNVENHFQHADGSYGTAARKGEDEAEKAVQMIRTKEALDQIAFQFGVVAHYVADVNHPLHTSDADEMEYLFYDEFNKLIASRHDKFRLVFYGYTLPLAKNPGIRAYLTAAAERTNRHYFPLGKAFVQKGKLVRAVKFDERSIPFGIASISYSHAVTDVANVWLTIWARSGKTIDFTPYLKKPSKPTATDPAKTKKKPRGR